MPFNLRDNFCINPDILLRQRRYVELVESPAAPPPPRYNWRLEESESYTPDRTIKTIYPSSSHSLSDNDTTITPDVKIVPELFDTNLSATPVVPGSFVHTPMPASQGGSSGTATVKGKDGEERPSKDEIIEALHERMRQLEKENATYGAQAEAAAADRRRIEALEATISQIMNTRSPVTGDSGGSSNPFVAHRLRNNTVTPTPAGPRAGTFGADDVNRQSEAIPIAQPKPRPPLLMKTEDRLPVTPGAESRQSEGIRQVSIQDPVGRVVHALSNVDLDQTNEPTALQTVEIKSDERPVKTTLASDIKISEVPKFTGPSENPAALFNWQRLIEQYFSLKNVTDDGHRLIILGSVLIEPRAGSWFVNSFTELKELKWDQVLNELAVETLPTGWLEDTEKAIRQLKMGSHKDFKTYVGRARDLYNIVQVQTSLTPRNLAEYIVWGTPDVFQRWVKDRALMQVTPFKILPFVSAANNVWDMLVASNLVARGRLRPMQTDDNPQPATRMTQSSNNQVTDTRTADQRADAAWRYHQFMRQKGLCGYCRTQCGNPNCRGPAKGAFVSVPESFNPGPRPVRRQDSGINPWIRPTGAAPAKLPGAPGAATSKPAGRPTTSSTLVASVQHQDNNNQRPDLFAQDIARYEEADRILVAHLAEEKEEDSRRNQLDVGSVEQTGANSKETARGTD